MSLTNMSGPFYATNPYKRTFFQNTTIDGQQESVGNFDMSRTSAIYRDDVSTVRPDAFRSYCLIRYS